MKTHATPTHLYFRLEPAELAFKNGEGAALFRGALKYIPHLDHNPLNDEYSVPIVYAMTVETKREIYLTDGEQGSLF